MKILSIAMVVWSGMTALCGLAQNFWMLLLARIGVGVGEAGASPPSHSLISDYFPIETRATALSIYALGIPFRIHGRQFSWVVGVPKHLAGGKTFVLVGLPGILVALLIWITLKEPPRGMADRHIKVDDAPAPGVKEVIARLWQRVSFRHIGLRRGSSCLRGLRGRHLECAFSDPQPRDADHRGGFPGWR